DAKVPVRLRSREWEQFEKLMRPPPGADIKMGRLSLVTEVVNATLEGAPAFPPVDGRSPAREITMVYFGEVDDVAHHHGARSAEYQEAAEHMGALIPRVAASLDLEQDSLIVFSDHGPRPEGGHGGLEPLATSAFVLAAGGLLRHGVELAQPRPIRDLA